MVSELKYFAVLTGDLVESSLLSPEESRSAMSHLVDAASDFELSFPRSVHGHIDTFRHDSWQLMLQQPVLAVRAALFLRCSLMSMPGRHDSRVFIGLGGVDEISADRISDSRGEAFSHSGKGLDSLKKARFGFSSPMPWFADHTGLAGAMLPLLDEIMSDWTSAQSRSVRGTLLGWTHEEVAERWTGETKRITRPAVSKHLRAAHWSGVSRALEWAEGDLESAVGGC